MRWRRLLESLGLRQNPADDDLLAIALVAGAAFMLLTGHGPRDRGALGTWWSLFAAGAMAVLVAKAMRPQRHWAVKAIGGVAVVSAVPLGVALIAGARPVGAVLTALVLVPALLAGLVIALGRRGASSPGAGR